MHVVDGLLTGWHEPEASHLLMLEAVAGRALLERVVRGEPRRGLPLARVRRRAPDPAVTNGSVRSYSVVPSTVTAVKFAVTHVAIDVATFEPPFSTVEAAAPDEPVDLARGHVVLELGERRGGVAAVEAADRHDGLAGRELVAGCVVGADRRDHPRVVARVPSTSAVMTSSLGVVVSSSPPIPPPIPPPGSPFNRLLPPGRPFGIVAPFGQRVPCRAGSVGCRQGTSAGCRLRGGRDRTRTEPGAAGHRRAG